MSRDEKCENIPPLLPDNIASDEPEDLQKDINKVEPLGNTRDKTSGNKKQGNQLIYWFFTYNNYPDKTIEILETKFKQICSRWVFQKEIGKDGTPHIQGNIQLKKKMRWSEFDLPKEIHWEKTRDKYAAFNYCKKADTRVGDNYWEYPPQQAPKRELKLITNLYPWQEQIKQSCLAEPDDRTVNWIYDEQGCCGKTQFSKYMCATQNAIVATGGSNKDIACLLAMLKKAGRDLNEITTFIFNFPRSTEGISFKAIESVKDGLMTSVKYETETLYFNSPHVWCFSNELPRFSALTNDRWKTWTIKDKKLTPYQIEGALKSPIDKTDLIFEHI